MRREDFGRLTAAILARMGETGRLVAAVSVVCATVFAVPAFSQDAPRLTGETPPTKEVPAPPVPKWVTDDVRKMRAYPEQPPVIPHSIDGYQISINTNRCLSCHKREFTQGSGAPMISVTHFMDRQGQMLADVSPRRYVCTMCHVPQADVPPLVPNDFKDMTELGFKPAGSE